MRAFSQLRIEIQQRVFFDPQSRKWNHENHNFACLVRGTVHKSSCAIEGNSILFLVYCVNSLRWQLQHEIVRFSALPTSRSKQVLRNASTTLFKRRSYTFNNRKAGPGWTKFVKIKIKTFQSFFILLLSVFQSLVSETHIKTLTSCVTIREKKKTKKSLIDRNCSSQAHKAQQK